MNQYIKAEYQNIKNFVFVGGTGSGKSEIAINFAKYLKCLGEKQVCFFDMDMTKPIFRSRDAAHEIEAMDIEFYYEDQFYDTPVLVGGVLAELKNEKRYVVLDVGGDYTGVRSIGAYATELNAPYTSVFYVVNSFRPWSADIEQIDNTLRMILGCSNIRVENIHIIGNPNVGALTTVQEFVDGIRQIQNLIHPYKEVEWACVREELYKDIKKYSIRLPVLPLHLYLTGS